MGRIGKALFIRKTMVLKHKFQIIL